MSNLTNPETGSKADRILMKQDSCYVVAEIGINHNGDLENARKLIEVAARAGCDAVKFQKRTVDVVYTPEELALPRESPLGETNGDLKRGLEFGRTEYDEIDRYCRQLDIEWYAAPWDLGSLEFLAPYDIPFIKVASAMATDADLLAACCATGKPLMVSTGMCDLDLIRKIVAFIEQQKGRIGCLYHCVSTYPARIEDLNLKGIWTLMSEFPGISIGYSGHEAGVPPSLMAAVMGAASVERHITLSRAMWGSDQAASLEPQGITRLVRDIRSWEAAQGDGDIRILKDEEPIARKLRRKNSFGT
jgi:N-acetylneuraminate synthase